MEKIQEIKKLNVQIMGVRSDMVKNEDQLKDLQRYRLFLDNLTPSEFLSDAKKEESKGDLSNACVEPTIYFKEPNQLLEIFSELEENNLALIQDCQETEEILEELRAKISETAEKMYPLS